MPWSLYLLFYFAFDALYVGLVGLLFGRLMFCILCGIHLLQRHLLLFLVPETLPPSCEYQCVQICIVLYGLCLAVLVRDLAILAGATVLCCF